ncbi:MAG: arsenosugar biosynthesis radical SAM protein ArsS [Nitrospirae bacterium]|nr:arsenosugar biosynthesis radical SAM protein ArsS [Nitrospirota bacterium]
MNDFDRKLKEIGCYPLTAKDISTIQCNIGYKCNLRCNHCHVSASPERKDTMSIGTISAILRILENYSEIATVDITGGAPELNPYFEYFVKACAALGRRIIVRSNLAVYFEHDKIEIPRFLSKHKVKIIASLPCYTEEGVDKQRGKGTYVKAVSALKYFNSLGYGQEGSGLEVDIMFNPAGAGAAPEQGGLEKAYKEKLGGIYGVVFNRLIALSNMPIGRLGKSMSSAEKEIYLEKLKEKFNPDTVKNLMCRHLINISPQGRLFDCDFWQMLNMPVKSGCQDVEDFDYETLSRREIVANTLCFMCTAGAGASCSGALA